MSRRPVSNPFKSLESENDDSVNHLSSRVNVLKQVISLI